MIDLNNNDKINQSGFSLLEVIVAIAIFALAFSEILPAFNNFTARNSYSHIRVAAIQAAEQTLDKLRSISPSSLPTSGNDEGQTVNIGKYSFDVTTYYCEQANLCSSISTRQLRVNVKNNGKSIVNIQTVFTALQ
ncbi:MAG TPA: type II secretion system protein [Oligoflexia bacterium]|nr:type II secretion system protein [Oligoflexia bacterium]HMP48360.1 type II secretion system protein [Oligoflexia bacterium]